jgi:uncharacterized protein YegP (UPF0339 family)
MPQDELAEIDVTEDEFDAMMAESEPVEVTGPFDPARRVRFELISGNLHNYRWRLVAADGEILAISAASYRSLEDARRALSALTVAMQNAPIVDADDADDPVSHRRAS